MDTRECAFLKSINFVGLVQAFLDLGRKESSIKEILDEKVATEADLKHLRGNCKSCRIKLSRVMSGETLRLGHSHVSEVAKGQLGNAIDKYFGKSNR